MTMSSQTFSLKLFGLCCVVIGATEFLLVLERAIAALFKAYKFDFDGGSPVILDLDLVITFFVAASLFLVVCLIGIRVSRKYLSQATKIFALSVWLNVVSVAVMGLLLMSPLART